MGEIWWKIFSKLTKKFFRCCYDTIHTTKHMRNDGLALKFTFLAKHNVVEGISLALHIHIYDTLEFTVKEIIVEFLHSVELVIELFHCAMNVESRCMATELAFTRKATQSSFSLSECKI